MLIFFVFVAAFFLSQFFRHANAVISQDLMREFTLTAGQLGLMTSLFYLAFAAAQLPLGGLLDRHGPRCVTSLIMMAAVPGCLLFASANSFSALGAGRALIGLGMSGVLMGAYMALGSWFPPERFATLAGLLVGLGSLGGLGAAIPLAWLNEIIGWRTVFYICATLVVLSAAAIAIWARSPTPQSPGVARSDPMSSVIVRPATIAAPAPVTATSPPPHTLRDVLATRDFWRIASMYFWMPGIMLAVQGLWAGPFLYDVLQLSGLRVGGYLMLLSIGVVMGNLVGGLMGDRLGSGRMGFAAGTCLLAAQLGFVALALWPNEAIVWPVYFLFGFSAGFQILVLVHARHVFPQRLAGRVLTGVNMFGFLGAATVQWIMGLVIEAFGRDQAGCYPPVAYIAAFALTAGGLALALFWYKPLAWSREAKRSLTMPHNS